MTRDRTLVICDCRYLFQSDLSDLSDASDASDRIVYNQSLD